MDNTITPQLDSSGWWKAEWLSSVDLDTRFTYFCNSPYLSSSTRAQYLFSQDDLKQMITSLNYFQHGPDHFFLLMTDPIPDREIVRYDQALDDFSRTSLQLFSTYPMHTWPLHQDPELVDLVQVQPRDSSKANNPPLIWANSNKQPISPPAITKRKRKHKQSVPLSPQQLQHTPSLTPPEISSPNHAHQLHPSGSGWKENHYLSSINAEDTAPNSSPPQLTSSRTSTLDTTRSIDSSFPLPVDLLPLPELPNTLNFKPLPLRLQQDLQYHNYNTRSAQPSYLIPGVHLHTNISDLTGEQFGVLTGLRTSITFIPSDCIDSIRRVYVNYMRTHQPILSSATDPGVLQLPTKATATLQHPSHLLTPFVRNFPPMQTWIPKTLPLLALWWSLSPYLHTSTNILRLLHPWRNDFDRVKNSLNMG